MIFIFIIEYVNNQDFLINMSNEINFKEFCSKWMIEEM